MTDLVPGDVVLRARDLRRQFSVRRSPFRRQILNAVDGVSFDLHQGETLAIVGESGCGKSTLGRMLALIDTPTSGQLEILGTDVTALPAHDRRRWYRRVQMVFQNPFGSLNPRMTVGSMLAEFVGAAADPHPAISVRQAVASVLAKVGLRPEFAERYPHMLSGGQRQRVAIARALILQPAIIVADEPLSALDVSIQAQIINLLMDLRDELRTSFVFISHDISVVRRLAHNVMVMYLGRPVEYGPAAAVLANPVHPYTKALLASVPRIRHATVPRAAITGEIPSPINLPPGCSFFSRCAIRRSDCADRPPSLELRDNRLVACPYSAGSEISAVEQVFVA